MAIQNDTLEDKQKEACAITNMRRMIEKYSEKTGKTFEDVFFQFANSSVYEALFDYDTEIWKEGPDYLMALFEDVL